MNFDDWPLEQRIDYVTGFIGRAELIRRSLHLSGYNPGDITPGYRMRKDELAAIYLTLRRCANT
ncbi:hypothetical protein ACFR9U_17270 [Halorientalis brevis]|uniref:Uncharacterized protein n=1 Tax=Halorientalis brevis TaxID=1126241 RepID=A0ABD6CHK6_9EURY|nr:hypothetical protein [Halorientalis brevis]